MSWSDGDQKANRCVEGFLSKNKRETRNIILVQFIMVVLVSEIGLPALALSTVPHLDAMCSLHQGPGYLKKNNVKLFHD